MRRQTGFTLIELMIVVAVIAIIAAIAYPAYLDQVRKSHRGDAQGQMLALSQAMERCFTRYNSYQTCIDDNHVDPDDFNTDRYTLSFSQVDDTGFEVQAVPGSTGGQNNDKCGTMTVDHRGETGAEADDCWN